LQPRAGQSDITAAARSCELLGYGVHFPDLWGRAPSFVDRILKGGRPATMPVERAAAVRAFRKSENRHDARSGDSASGRAARRRNHPLTPSAHGTPSRE